MADQVLKIEEKLAAQSEKMRQLEVDLKATLDNMPAMIGYWDCDLRNRFGNHAYFDWFGIDPAKMPGMHIRDVIGEERYHLNLPYITKALQGERQQFERAIPTPDGSAIRHSLADYIPDLRDGKVHGFFVMVSDVTRLKETEQKLVESERQWHALVNAEPEWISLIDAQGVILQINPAGLSLLEADSPEQVVGQDITTYLPKAYQADFLAAHASVISGSPLKFEMETTGIRGGHHWLSAHSVPLDYKGATVHLAMIRDVSERKEMELNLKRSNAELEQFAYVASHDLRQPLRMISSYLTLLDRSLSDRLDAEERSFLNFAVDGAFRMDRMITDLLDYSRICRDMGAVKPVALADTVARAMGNLQLAIADSGASVTADPNLPVVPGFETELERLFQNLIGNALKFHAKGRAPKVAIHCEDMATEWVVAVSDNGIGIAQEHQARLFLIFQRLVSQDEFPGTGIGLAACRKIVENHGGRIWVESTVGEGSTFLFTLPKTGQAQH